MRGINGSSAKWREWNAVAGGHRSIEEDDGHSAVKVNVPDCMAVDSLEPEIVLYQPGT
jgi:hypothetical protein